MTDLMFTLRMCRRLARLSIAGVAGVLLVACPAAAPARADDDSRLLADAATIAAGLDPRVASTLAAIPDPGRRLLALRSYLRAGDTLSERWSWTAEEIRRYEQSQEFRDAQAELDLVVAEFAATNPGYTLYVNRQVRSLDVQIERWNGNASVGAAAQELLTTVRPVTWHTAASKAANWLQRVLADWTPPAPVTLAAPGLSAHGQSRAFDFQVQRGSEIVAGTEAARAAQEWNASGWTERLRAAVLCAGPHLHGPLEAPLEPWHYVYSGSGPPTEAARERPAGHCRR